MPARRGRISPVTVFFALLSLVLGILLYRRMRPPTPPTAPPPAATQRPSRKTPRPEPRPGRTPPLAPPSGARPAPPGAAEPRIGIVIDDLGNDHASVERIARWPYEVGGAVLPGLPGSVAAARRLAAAGKEVLLHLPMEPRGYPAVRPGPGVVLRSQTDAEITRTLLEDLESVPGAAGVNNHMGSAATADVRVMDVVAGVLSQRGLYFVDSRTTDSTVAYQAAEKARVPSVSRRVFLDATPTRESVERAYRQLLRRAREDGSAVALGHPHAATLDVLERELPKLAGERVRLVRVSELVR